MHDTAIKNFCIWARRELMAEVERRCAIFDISEAPENPVDADAVGGRVLSAAERRQRSGLISAIRENGFEHVVERAAYTWFNRIMAIRFMEANDRLPSRTRLLSGNDGSFAPQALAEALQVDIEGVDRARVAKLVQAGDDEATFRYLFLAQCAELASCMPDVFEKVGSDMELLLPDGLLRKDGVIARMVADIPEDDWREGVEIVGWMYQYYVSERKDEYFAAKRKATREDLAPATQLFTPEWIARYLVENSLGRLWMLNHPESGLSQHMDYYIALDNDAETGFRRIGSPEEISVVDPACGSGHILVYAFDLLALMYEEQGYSRRDIPRLILANNLTGLEIDPRAAAMASFALIMKACELDSRFLRRGVRPRITVLSRVEFNEDERIAIARIMKNQERLDAPFLLERTELLDVLAHLDEAGSLFQPTEADLGSLRAVAETVMDEAGIFGLKAAEKAQQAIDELEPLVRTYDAVIANPPYLNTSSTNAWMSQWVKEGYPEGKSDLFAAFMCRGFSLANAHGYNAMVTMQSWMFLSSFESLRSRIIEAARIENMAHLGARAFDAISGEVVSTTAAVFAKDPSGALGAYVRLVEPIGEQAKSEALREAIRNPDCGWFYRANQQDFKKIPGSPIAYWASRYFVSIYEASKKVGDLCHPCKGIDTGNNLLFTRLWWEVQTAHFSYPLYEAPQNRWVPYNKGLGYRKWYGNNLVLLDWRNEGKDLASFEGSNLRNKNYYFKEGITWGTVTSGGSSFRFFPKGFTFDNGGCCLFNSEIPTAYLLGFLNSSMSELFQELSPTLNLQPGNVSSMPCVVSTREEKRVVGNVEDAISFSSTDWDSYETSWDFAEHPLVRCGMFSATLSQAYEVWKAECNERFYQLKANEEELNRIFAEIYHMEDEVPIEVPLDKVSVHIVFDTEGDVPKELKGGNYVRTKADEVKSLISYAVGCIMGRYSLDKPGLVLANQGDRLAQYLEQVPNPTFTPDADGIIPLTDVEYFHDDAVGLLVDFLEAAYGEAHLEENLQFVADALGGEGTPRQVIRAYFRNDFFADHCKTYSVQSAGKRPIYWLFDSGKKGGFRALFYMYRYTPDLIARLRTDYVHPQQERYRTQLASIDDAMASADRRELARLRKERKKISDQLSEINVYEEKVRHLADQMIKIDLDDGVKHNYALFQDVLAKIK